MGKKVPRRVSALQNVVESAYEFQDQYSPNLRMRQVVVTPSAGKSTRTNRYRGDHYGVEICPKLSCFSDTGFRRLVSIHDPHRRARKPHGSFLPICR